MNHGYSNESPAALLRAALLCAGSLLSVPAFPQSDTAWVSLFNGTDLTGWTEKSAATDIRDFAKVTDGSIDLQSPGGSGWLWLYSEEQYGNFVFKAKFSAPSGEQGNSGVNFRSLWDAQDQGGYLNGPQVDIYTAANWRTGLILDMTKGNERWLWPDLPNWNITRQDTPPGWTFKTFPEWNDLEIRAVGNRVTTLVNGIAYADWDGTPVLTDALHAGKGVGVKGHIALQAHSDQKVVIYFKDIRIADLDAVTALRHPYAFSASGKSIASETDLRRFSLDGRRVLGLPREGISPASGLFLVERAGLSRPPAALP